MEELNIVINDENELNIKIENSSSTGITDYEKLSNKPKINSVELLGDKSFENLGLNAITNIELENLLS